MTGLGAAWVTVKKGRGVEILVICFDRENRERNKEKDSNNLVHKDSCYSVYSGERSDSYDCMD